MRLLIVGHGRMGTLVESLAPSYGFEVAGSSASAQDEAALSAGALADADVAIDFTVPPPCRRPCRRWPRAASTW